MPKVLCTLENASDTINGVKFTLIEGVGRVSEEVTDSVAELFLSIPGYEPADDLEPAPAAPKPAKSAKKNPVPAPAPEPAPAPAPAADAAVDGDEVF